VHAALVKWLGGLQGEAWIKKVGTQYRGYNLKDQTLTVWGKVTKKYEQDGLHLVDLEIGVNDDKGENQGPGFATVVLSARHGH